MAGQDIRGPSTLAGGRLFGPAAAALGLILALAPLTVSVDLSGISLHQPTALAKGGNEGNGGDRGGDRGGNGQGNGGNANADDKRLKGQAAKAAARNRFNELHGNGNNGNGNMGNGHFVLTDGQTQVLLQQGWGPKPQIADDGFDNHGQRVSTMVHLANELGFSSSVGAMQANFLPADWYDLQAQWRAADGDAQIIFEAEITDSLNTLPGGGPLDEEWATVNLDVDGDGVITEADLLAAQEPEFTLESDTPDADDEIFWPAP